MLAHSPSLPLIIDYVGRDRDITAEEEEGMKLALQLRHRVRRIRLQMPLARLQKVIVAVDQLFPMLECLYIQLPRRHSSGLILPNTFQAPHLRHVILHNFAFTTGLPSLTTIVGLVTLSLVEVHGSTYFLPNDLLQQLSLLPQLETLEIDFHFPVPNRDIEGQLLHRPIITHVTLPNLRRLTLGGVTAYSEALLPRMTTPLLERLQIWLFFQLSYSVPRLLQFIGATESLRFGSAIFRFYTNFVRVDVYPHQGATMHTFSLDILRKDFDWQVASAAQIFSALRTVFSAVEHLTLEFRRNSIVSEMNREADRTQWQELLRSFSNVKTLRVDIGLVGQLSRALQVDDGLGEAPMELLPELKELEYSDRRATKKAFKAFIDARRNAGHPVFLVRR